MAKYLSLPVQLLLIIAFVFIFGGFVNETVIRGLYTFSMIFKELLQFFLPFVIFAFVLSGILSFKKNAPLILLILISSILCSNACVAILIYGVGTVLLPLVTCNVNPTALVATEQLAPLFSFSLPVLIPAHYALILSASLGIICSFLTVPTFEHRVEQFKKGIEWFLSKIFISLLPLYILGFLFKIKYEGTFSTLFEQYGATFVLIITLQVLYLVWFYFLASSFSLARTVKAINNALPSYITAFTTMSSTATIPVSVQAATKNIHNRSLPLMAMPIMANVHLIGDSIGTPLLALVTMVIFKGCMPSFFVYISFIFYFCITMFAVSGIPAGGIVVMMPILQSQLCFTPEMTSVMFTLYVLLDSFGTAANVMGDGALVIIVDKILRRLRLID